MLPQKPCIIMAAVLICVLPGSGSAAGGVAATAKETLGISGSMRGSWWSASKIPDENSDAFSASLWLKMATSLPTERIKLYFEGWGRNDSVFREGETNADLIQGYLDASFGPVDIRAGRQIIAWGKADSVNPTDNLSPRDYTILTPEDHDQHTGVGTLKMSLNQGNYRVSAIWLPEFRPNKLPLPKSPGTNFSEEIPDKTSNQWAAKLEYYGSDYDWSISYFDGLDRNPDLAFKDAGPAGVDVLLNYGRIKVVGAEGAVNLGRFGLRAEAAYLETTDADGKDPYIKNPVLYVVAGGDRTFSDNLNINAQLIYRKIVNFTDADSYADPGIAAIALQEQLANNQHDPVQEGMSVRISDKWLNEMLEAEVSGLIWFRHGDYIVRPRIKYAFNDNLSATLGGEIYDGPKNSFFGRLSSTSAFFTEMRWSF